MREGDLSGYPEPQDLTQRTLRFTFMDKDNSKEVLFAETLKQVRMVCSLNPCLI